MLAAILADQAEFLSRHNTLTRTRKTCVVCMLFLFSATRRSLIKPLRGSHRGTCTLGHKAPYLVRHDLWPVSGKKTWDDFIASIMQFQQPTTSTNNKMFTYETYIACASIRLASTQRWTDIPITSAVKIDIDRGLKAGTRYPGVCLQIYDESCLKITHIIAQASIPDRRPYAGSKFKPNWNKNPIKTNSKVVWCSQTRIIVCRLNQDHQNRVVHL